MISFNKGIASVAVCALGAACMYWTGNTGNGWAILGLWIVWAS